jgi:hypothetical protein
LDWGISWQLEHRVVDVQLDHRVERVYHDGGFCLPYMEAPTLFVGQELVALNAAAALVIADEDEPAREIEI